MADHTPDASVFDGWRKSSYSGPDAGSCLEVFDGHPSRVPVRDSKRADGPTLLFSRSCWASFIEAVDSATAPRGNGGTRQN
jgi:hypothetical protein